MCIRDRAYHDTTGIAGYTLVYHSRGFQLVQHEPCLLYTSEYCCQVPANRIGFVDNGGPFSLIQLKVIQEVVSLIVFTIIVTTLFRGESLHWNHMVAFCCLVAAVYFVFK